MGRRWLDSRTLLRLITKVLGSFFVKIRPPKNTNRSFSLCFFILRKFWLMNLLLWSNSESEKLAYFLIFIQTTVTICSKSLPKLFMVETGIRDETNYAKRLDEQKNCAVLWQTTCKVQSDQFVFKKNNKNLWKNLNILHKNQHKTNCWGIKKMFETNMCFELYKFTQIHIFQSSNPIYHFPSRIQNKVVPFYLQTWYHLQWSDIILHTRIVNSWYENKLNVQIKKIQSLLNPTRLSKSDASILGLAAAFPEDKACSLDWMTLWLKALMPNFAPRSGIGFGAAVGFKSSCLMKSIWRSSKSLAWSES